MKAIIKSREEKGTKADLFLSFWEQMLVNKFEEYGIHHIIRNEGYEVVKETEKAFQINIPADQLYRTESEYLGKDWNVWMPKKAFVGF